MLHKNNLTNTSELIGKVIRYGWIQNSQTLKTPGEILYLTIYGKTAFNKYHPVYTDLFLL